MTSYSAGPDFGLGLTIGLETLAYMRHGLSPTEGLIVSLVEPYSVPEVLPAHYIISRFLHTPMYSKIHWPSLFLYLSVLGIAS